MLGLLNAEKFLQSLIDAETGLKGNRSIRLAMYASDAQQNFRKADMYEPTLLKEEKQ